MADKIAVMNHGVIEQFGTPQEIYDRPATMFVADFIGSPPMNFLPFDGGLARGATRDRRAGRRGRGARSARGHGARPTWRSASGPSTSASTTARKLRGSVYGTEYLGTTQIVAVETADGMIKARVPADMRLAMRRAGRAGAQRRAAVALRQGVGPRRAHRHP